MVAVEQLSALVGTKSACHALEVSRATLYRLRRRAAFCGPTAPVKRPRPTSPRALDSAERQNVLQALHSERFVDTSPAQVKAILLDEDQCYLCSERTMYRILHSCEEVKERRSQARHPKHEMPQLVASAPNQVWSWDITKLRGPKKWTNFYLYVVLDIFSRYVVAWMVADSESADLAIELIATAYERQGIVPGQVQLHADRGSAMTSKSLAALMLDLGIGRSFSRPRVSNDNPFSESQFKTFKYHPDFPGQFANREHARTVSASLFDWYNEHHRHSGIGHLTPSDVHHGRDALVRARRAEVMREAFERTPERFVKGAPTIAAPPTITYINPPDAVVQLAKESPSSTQVVPGPRSAAEQGPVTNAIATTPAPSPTEAKPEFVDTNQPAIELPLTRDLSTVDEPTTTPKKLRTPHDVACRLTNATAATPAPSPTEAKPEFVDTPTSHRTAADSRPQHRR